MAAKKGTKRTSEGLAVQNGTAAALARAANLDLKDAPYVTSQNARAVQINNTSTHVTTEHHHHHHHAFTTVVTPASASAHGCRENVPPWQRSAQALADVEALLITAAAASEKHFNETVRNKDSLDKARDAAEAAVTQQQALIHEQTARMSKIDVEVTQARDRIAEINVADEDRLKSEAALASLSIMKSDVMVFQNGSFERPDDPKRIATLMPLVERINLDDRLVAAFPEAAAKRATLRSDWERNVVNEIEKAVQEHMNSVHKKLASHSLPDIQAALRVADGRNKQVTTTLKAAEAKKGTLATELDAARHASNKAESDVERARNDWNTASSFLRQFREGPLAAFRSMDDQLAGRLLARANMEDDGVESSKAGKPTVVREEKKLPFTFH